MVGLTLILYIMGISYKEENFFGRVYFFYLSQVLGLVLISI